MRRNEARDGNAASRNHHLHAARNLIEQRAQVRLGLECTNLLHCFAR